MGCSYPFMGASGGQAEVDPVDAGRVPRAVVWLTLGWCCSPIMPARGRVEVDSHSWVVSCDSHLVDVTDFITGCLGSSNTLC